MVFVIIATICVVFLILLCAMPTRTAVAAGIYEEQPQEVAEPPQTLRIATYNIHGAKGTDGVRDLRRIANEIKGIDIASIQEVRAGLRSSQARELGGMLSMVSLYTPALKRRCTSYRGNGLLSRFPVSNWETYPLPNVVGHRYRIYTVARVMVGEEILSILFTHLHTGAGREQQLKIVVEQFTKLPPPALLLGDLNTKAEDPLCSALQIDRLDALRHAVRTTEDPDRVDWILARGLEIIDGGSTDSGASDHPCYWADVRIRASVPAVETPSR